MESPRVRHSLLVLHHDPRQDFFAVTEGELKELEKSHASLWKDWFIVATSVFLPTAVNAYTEVLRIPSGSSTPELFLNALLASTSLLLATVFGFAWRRERVERSATSRRIRERPALPMLIHEVSEESLPPMKTEEIDVGELTAEITTRSLSHSSVHEAPSVSASASGQPVTMAAEVGVRIGQRSEAASA